jgi:hypothetical protein
VALGTVLHAQEITKTGGDADETLNVDELIAKAEETAPAVKSISDDRSLEGETVAFGHYFLAACDRANEKQLARLIDIYRELNPDSFAKISVLPSLMARWLRLEGEAIRRAGAKPKLPEMEIELPPEFALAPPELIESWRLYKRAMSSYEKTFPKEGGEQVEVYANLPTFYRQVAAALSGGEPGLEKDLRKYTWGGANCLSVSDTDDAKDMGILAVLLRSRRLDEAVGASLLVAGMEGSTSTPESVADPLIELFRGWGLDWERIFAGAQLQREIHPWNTFPPQKPFLDALGVRGSDRAAALVNQLARLTTPDDRRFYIETLGRWVEWSAAAKCKSGEWESGSSESKGHHVISKELQRACLRTIEELAVNAPERAASAALAVLGRVQSPTSIPILQGLAKHESPSVAESATHILCAMGFETPATQTGPPVRFRILVNGEPLGAESTVGWQIESPGGRESNSQQVKAGGIVELARKYFTNPRRLPEKVEFSDGFQDGGTEFEVAVPAPANLDTTTDVEVKSSTLEITLENLDKLNAPAPDTARLQIRRRVAEYTFTEPFRFHEGEEVPTRPSIRLPMVQPAKYDVAIRVAGAETWLGDVEVGPGPTKLFATLKPGSDVHFVIVDPQGRRTIFGQLWKDGKKVENEPDYRSDTYRSLPCGKYVIRIPGNERRDQPEGTHKLTRGPDEVLYAAREVPFTIEKGSPALIELGQIHLEPLP